jgi:hypothetical protein
LFNKKNVVFLTKDRIIKLSKKSNIILSPEFYWVIRKKLPVKLIWQAKKLCDSIFDGILPQGEYVYKIIKDNDYFLLFAYDIDFILKNLKLNGIDTNMIDDIYLAQNELLKDVSYRINEQIVTNIDGIFTMIPAKLYDCETQNIDSISFESLSNVKISISKYDLLIDKKSLNFIIISLMIYISLISIEIFIYKNNLNNMKKRKQHLYEKYNLPHTSWQLNSIQNKVKKINISEIKFRDKVYKVLSLNLQDNEYFMNLVFKKNNFSFKVKLNYPARAKTIKNQLERYFTISQAVVTDGELKMELSYD